MRRLMITAASSNSGKTAVTCGLLALLKRRGLEPAAFKCGPDYIDPMFHRSVLGIRSSNLDVFLAGEDGVRAAFARGSEGCDVAVCEGVMGYYDGQTASSARASAWHVAQLCDLPAVLVIRPKGAALTLAAVIKGMAEFQPGLDEGTELAGSTELGGGAALDGGGNICGVIFNDCSEMYYKTYGPVIQKASGIPVLGYLPHMEEAVFESRHLGLMTAEEIRDLGERIDRIAARMEETIDVERLLAIMSRSEEDPGKGSSTPAKTDPDAARSVAPDAARSTPANADPEQTGSPRVYRIAVAKDAAFNFIYAESIAALERAGAQIVYFSPINDPCLPPDICGLYLPGGYPELYGKELAENTSMRESIRRAVLGSDPSDGPLPTIAECGGFLYLGQTLADEDGKVWPMAGALPGHGEGTGKLVRFGYGFIGCQQDSMLFRAGEQIPVHEFHYWDTTQQGSDLTLTKNSNGKQWRFGYASDTLYAGFPHLYLAGRCGRSAAAWTGAPNAPIERSATDEENALSATSAPTDPDAVQTLAGRFLTAARKFADQADPSPIGIAEA